MKNPREILITGASSGLGKALALCYAQDKCSLHLFGRDHKRLKEVSDLCIKKGAKSKIYLIDICQKELLFQTMEQINKENDLDIIIANAGISAGTLGKAESEIQVNEIFATNLNGVLNTILPWCKFFEEKRKGQIVIVSSLAGITGLPSCPAYSASKGAVRMFGEGLRGVMQRSGVGVTVLLPGYIKTPMTDVNNFPMPFIISADYAASIIKRKLKRNPARIAFPLTLYFSLLLLNSVMLPFKDLILRKLPGKKPKDA